MRASMANASRSVLAASAIFFTCLQAFAGGPLDRVSASQSQDDDATDQIIIKMRDPSTSDIANRIRGVSVSSGVLLTHLREMSGNSHVVKLAQKLKRVDVDALARRLASDPNVLSVESDKRVFAQRLPNDPMYAQQWHYYETAGGVNLPPAWDITTGSNSIVIAVIDTGIRPHIDLSGRVLPGYDFIVNTTTSNDGDGRDNDASDPGDYCNGGGSSWHGTHVAGTIGAASNNSSGVSGVNWVSKVLPVRVLGTCGGYNSDVIDGLRWASGLSVPGVPSNPNPARVANLSLGGANGGCSASFQSAINEVTARGMVVVVAAGNSAADASTFEPASCAGVVTVAATVRNGGKASYSNYGAKVAISAPGGGSGGGVLSTLNSGSTVPGADSYAYYQGTSMATPHVAGVASLMLSVNPALTSAQVTQILQSSARRFPTGTGSDCSTALCGAGIVDAGAAVAAAGGLPPVAPALVNVALQSNGGILTASSSHSSGYLPSGANNGDRRGANWGFGGGWNDSTPDAYPDWLQAEFNGTKSISEIDIFSVQDNYTNPVEPTETQTFTLYGLTTFDVQYWNGSAWLTVPGGNISGNNKVWRKLTFPAISTDKVRVQISNSLGTWSRIAEIEAYAPAVNTPALVNVASQVNGAVASATTTYSAGYAPSGAINGDRRGANWGSGGGWNNLDYGAFPQALQVNFASSKTISEVDLFMVQDAYTSPVEPTPTMTFSRYGLTDFDIQYWNGATWVTVPGGAVSANNLVWRKFTFAPIATNAIRVNVRNAADGYSRVTEIEAY